MDNNDAVLRKAGLMSAHAELFGRLNELQQLLALAEMMEERRAGAALVSVEALTLYGPEPIEGERLITGKGREVGASVCYRVLGGLKGHDADRYAVTVAELKALNAGAVAEVRQGDALAAFAATLTKIEEAVGETPRRSRGEQDATAPVREMGQASG